MLGVVQGGAEVYPVSSSAQLTLLPWLAGWDPPADRTRFAAALHAGSAVGLALALRQDLRDLRPAEVRWLALSSAPAAVAGLLLQGPVERRLGGPGPTAALLAAGALALWAADRRDRAHGTGTPRAAGRGDLVAASLAQVAALAPGVSRTGATLTALRARGVGHEPALRLSLLMSLPVTGGAALLTAVRGGRAPEALPSALAAGTAFLAARRVAAPGAFVTGTVLYRLGLAAAVAARLRGRVGIPVTRRSTAW